MPVGHRLVMQKGWKAKENNRYGDCLVVQYYDTETKQVLFNFAPKLSDIPEFEEYFAIVKEYDIKMKLKRLMDNGI